jgi:membrane associated rhomboid family serine protease
VVVTPQGHVEVYRTASEREARERALVLEARGIPHVLVLHDGARAIHVAAGDAARARAELAAFGEENRGWPPRRVPTRPVTDGLGVASAWCVLLTGFMALQRTRAFGVDWTAAGTSVSERVLAGEPWRAVTALTLHADALHLAGNLVFGALFVAGLAQAVGAGAAAFLALGCGAAGNLLNALLHGPGHASLGASTAVFAAIGLLVAFQCSVRRGVAWSRLQRWTPPVLGVVFLMYLGTAGERTDVLAHACGFATGGAAGVLVGRAWPDVGRRGRAQRLLGLAAVAVLAVAWTLASRHAP